MAARVVVLLNPLDASRRRRYELAEGTRVLDWVDFNEPAPGNAQRCVYLNEQELTDRDYVAKPHDEVLVTFTPGWTAVAVYALQVVIGVAIGYALNLLFGPSAPKAASTPAPSQVYGLGLPRNAARLGQPIPVIYGAVIATPDFAAQPYLVFVGNEQYLHALLCIGQGDHDVTELLLGQSSARQLDATVVSWQVFQPADHGSTYGRIQKATGVRENVVTSASVGGQELLAPNAANATVPSTYYWRGGTPLTSMNPPAYDIDARGASSLTQILALMPANPTLGTVRVVLVAGGGGELYITIAYTAAAYDAAQSVPPNSLIPPPTNAAGANVIGPFETCKAGQAGAWLELDFVFPGGLFTMDGSGNLGPATVAVRIRYTSIDDAGAAIGSEQIHDETFTASTNTPQRFTRGWTVPSGRFRVKATRTTNSDGKASTSDRVTWAGLKIELNAPGRAVYGNVTLVALKLKATNGISSDAAASVRFRVKRRLARLADPALATNPTTNPADAFADIVCAPYGGNRPRNADELDLTALADARTLWAGADGFNAVFDQPSTVWEALTLALQCVHAAPLPIASRMSLIHDGPQAVRAQLFSDANIAAGSLQVTDSFDVDGTPVGIRANYRDARTFSEASYRAPADAPDYLTLDLFGCTSATVAQELATIAANKRRLQRTTIQFATELEGLSCLPGDRIGVQAGMMAWAQGARVERVAGLRVWVDRALTWTASATHAVQLRDAQGVPTRLVGVTAGATPNELVLPSAAPFALVGYGDTLEPTHLTFGVIDTEVTDWTVTKMTPQGAAGVLIDAVNYNPAVWAGGAVYQQLDALDERGTFEEALA